jgi:transcriptional regulator with XRE-family HTH domain
MMNDTSSNLALNVRHLRSARQLSQVQLAKIAGIPRPTLANLESGTANPTLSVLMRLASALQVLIAELVAPPRSSIRHFSVDQLPQRQRGSVHVRKLLPDSARGLDVERMEIPAGAHLVAIPHVRGSREYFSCEQGSIVLTVNEEEVEVLEGDVVVFRGDQRHSYRNPGAETAIGYSVVTMAPVPDHRV